MGFALMQYFKHQIDKPLMVRTTHTDFDEYSLPYFFRNFNEMPEIEQDALNNVHGKILDVGAGTGIHSITLKELGFEVKPIDISPYAVEIMKSRGIEEAEELDFFKIKDQKYDTILLLMNGLGLVERLDKFESFFKHCKSILNPGGQILCDSSDLIYLFEEEDGSFIIDLNADYYGEVDFFVEYDGQKQEAFPWLFVDFDNLKFYAEQNGFNAEIVVEGAHYDYLAKLTLAD
jgi:SAM-dependent methyltransferase